MPPKKLYNGNKALYLLLAAFLTCMLCFSVFAQDLISDYPNEPARSESDFPDMGGLPGENGIDYQMEGDYGGGKPIEEMMGRVVNLPPMYPENMPIDEMVMGKLGGVVLEKYSFEELVSMCPNEDAILEKVMATLDEEELKRACEPLEEDLKRCEEAKDFCSEMEFGPMQAPMPFPSDKEDNFSISCPPEMDELVQLCLEKTNEQERRIYEENKEFMGLDCEIEWERNVYNYERMCEDYKREMEDSAKWENCPPKDELNRKDQECKTSGRIAEWRQDSEGCPIVDCRDTGPSQGDSERQKQNCQRMGMSFREYQGASGGMVIECVSGEGKPDGEWQEGSGCAPIEDIDRQKQKCKNDGMNYNEYQGQGGCPVIECVSIEGHAVDCPPREELERKKQDCESQGKSWHEGSDNSGCPAIYCEEMQIECQPREELERMDNDCVNSGGTPHRHTDSQNCELVECVFEGGGEPTPEPRIEQTPEPTPEQTPEPTVEQTPELTPEQTPESPVESTPELVVEAQQDPFSSFVMPVFYSIVGMIYSPPENKEPPMDMGPNEMYPKDMGPNNMGPGNNNPVPGDGGTGGYGPSYMEDRSIFCDKERFIRECTLEREEKIAKEFETRNYEKICELEMKRSIRYIERFCEEKDRGKEDCLMQAERGCSVIEKTIDKCKQIVEQGEFEGIIKRKVHEMCRFSPYRVEVQVKSIDEFSPSEVIPIIVSTSDGISPEQEEILRRFGIVNGFNSISGIRVYSMSASAATVQEIRALQFVDEVQLDHLARALEAQQKKISERPQTEQKIIKTISVLDAAELEVSDQYKDMVSAGKVGLVNVSDGIGELDEAEKNKDVIYHLTKFIGMQAEREIGDAEKLAEQVEKLKETITLLSAIAEDIDDPAVKANLLNMIKDLETQVEEMTASIEAKKGGAGGLPGMIGALFSGGQQK